MKKRPIQDRLAEHTRRLVETYRDDAAQRAQSGPAAPPAVARADRRLLEKLFAVIYPGFFGNQHLTRENVAYHVGALLDDIADELDEQVRLAIRSECRPDEPCAHCASSPTASSRSSSPACPRCAAC